MLIDNPPIGSFAPSSCSLRAGKAAPPAGGSPAAPAAVSAVPKPPEDPPQLVETVMKLFDRWARLLDEQPTEKVHKPFVQELHSGGLLKVRWGWEGGSVCVSVRVRVGGCEDGVCRGDKSAGLGHVRYDGSVSCWSLGLLLGCWAAGSPQAASWARCEDVPRMLLARMKGLSALPTATRRVKSPIVSWLNFFN